MKNNYLITGGCGFIGANFIFYLLEKYNDIKLVNVDFLTYASNDPKIFDEHAGSSTYFFEKADICDKKKIAEILRKYNIDTIVHFAAESHVDRSIIGPDVFVKTNVLGTFTLLEEAHKYWLDEKKFGKNECRFHHVSTDEVYGELGPDDPPFTETTPYDPSSPYSASKAGSDHFVRAYMRTYGLPATISNCSNNYGPYQHPEKLIPTVIRACIEKTPIPVYGDGSNIRDWLYVEDHCSAIDAIVRDGTVGETYNVGGNSEVDNLSLVKMICEIMDEKRPIDGKHEDLITFVEDRLGHDWRYAIDNRKIKDKLNWVPTDDLKVGMEDTIKFYV